MECSQFDQINRPRTTRLDVQSAVVWKAEWLNKLFKILQRFIKWCAPGLAKFPSAVPYLFCLTLPGSFVSMFCTPFCAKLYLFWSSLWSEAMQQFSRISFPWPMACYPPLRCDRIWLLCLSPNESPSNVTCDIWWLKQRLFSIVHVGKSNSELVKGIIHMWCRQDVPDFRSSPFYKMSVGFTVLN